MQRLTDDEELILKKYKQQKNTNKKWNKPRKNTKQYQRNMISYCNCDNASSRKLISGVTDPITEDHDQSKCETTACKIEAWKAEKALITWKPIPE